MIATPRIKIADPDVLEERQRLEDERAYLSSAMEAKYLRPQDAIRLRMQSGVLLSIPRHLIDELANVPDTTLERDLTLAVGGDALSVRSLDVDISVAGLLRDVLGFNFQRLGGLAKSEAKAHAAKINGQKGGRPKRVTSDDDRSEELTIEVGTYTEEIRIESAPATREVGVYTEEIRIARPPAAGGIGDEI